MKGKRHARKYRLAHALWILPSMIIVAFPIYRHYQYYQYQMTTEYGKRPLSKSANKVAEEEFRKITCKMVRQHRGGSPTKYQINHHDVIINWDPHYT